MGSLELLLLNKPRRKELIERDEIQLRKRCVVKHTEMVVLRHQIVGTGSKSAVHKLVIVGVCGDDAHAEVWVNELHVLLVQYQHNHVLGNSRCNLLLQYLLVFVQNLVRRAERKAPGEECVPYRAIGTLAGDNLQQAVGVNHYGVHRSLLVIGGAKMRASQLLHAFLVELAALPELVHLFVNLLGVERCQLLSQIFQPHSSLDVGNQVEHLYLCRGEGNCFHNRCRLYVSAAKIQLISLILQVFREKYPFVSVS